VYTYSGRESIMQEEQQQNKATLSDISESDDDAESKVWLSDLTSADEALKSGKVNGSSRRMGYVPPKYSFNYSQIANKNAEELHAMARTKHGVACKKRGV
jgi:hypothetical protein